MSYTKENFKKDLEFAKTIGNGGLSERGKGRLEVLQKYENLILSNASTQRETFNSFFEYLDNLTKIEYDANSLTGHSEDYLKSI